MTNTHIAETTRNVNGSQTGNQQAGIGHNSDLSFDEAVEQNRKTSTYLICREMLITAIQDRRLDRTHLRVLAAIASQMLDARLFAWPDRATIAGLTGMSPKAVSNAIYELRQLGYLIVDRRDVDEAGGRNLTVYTFGNIDHDTIRRVITDTCRHLMADREEKKRRRRVPPIEGTEFLPGKEQDAHAEFPPGKELPSIEGTRGARHVPAIEGTSLQGRNKTSTPSSIQGGNSQVDALLSNIYNNITTTVEDNNNRSSSANKPQKSARGSRLADNWTLPKPWGEWALANFQITREQVLAERDAFKDFWLSATGAKATKADWFATWRNWVRNSRKGYRPRANANPVELDLPLQADETADEWKRAREMLGGDDA